MTSADDHPGAAPEPLQPKAESWPYLPVGSVLEGRYDVRSAPRTLEAIGGVSLIDGADRNVGGRPVLLVAARELSREAGVALWQDAARCGAAPPLDVLQVRGGAVGVFAVDERASALQLAVDLSRNQRAAVCVDAWSVVENLRDQGVAARVGDPLLLGAVRVGAEARLTAIAAPAGPDAWSADVAALGQLIVQALWGASRDASAVEIVDTLPDDVARALRPCFASPIQPVAVPSSTALSAVLGVGGADRRVPVPVAARPMRAQNATWKSRRRRVTRAAIVPILVMTGGVLALLAALSVLLRAPEYVEVAGAADAVPEAASPPTPWVPNRLPEPEILVQPWSDQNEGWTSPQYYAAFDDGPVPRPIGPMFTERPTTGEPYVRAFYDASGAVSRVDSFDLGDQFSGYRTFHQTSDGLAVLSHATCGRLERTTRFTEDGHLMRETWANGESTEPGCDALRLALDSRDRVTTSRCVDRNGAVVPFPGGFDVVRFTYEGRDLRPIEHAWTREDGSLIDNSEGYAAARLAWDERGRNTLRATFDSEGNPVPDPSVGAPVVRTTYTASPPATERRLYGQDAATPPSPWAVGTTPVLGDAGWHQERFVVLANRDVPVAERTTYGTEGFRAPQDPEAVVVTSYELDERGHVIALETRNAEGRLVAAGVEGRKGEGPARTEFAVDPHGHVIHECDFDSAGQAIATGRLGGAHCVVYWRDERGRTIAQSSWSTERRPANDSNTGAHRMEFGLDTLGRVLDVSYFSSAGNPVIVSGDAYGVQYEYNAYGDVLSRRFVTREGTPANLDRADWSTWQWDERGRWTEQCEGRTGNADQYAYANDAACVLREFDGGRLTQVSFADARRSPVSSRLVGERGEEAAVVRFVWDGDRIAAQERFNLRGERLTVEPIACDRPGVCIDETGRDWLVP